MQLCDALLPGEAAGVSATFFFLADSQLLVTSYWGQVDPKASQRLRDARAADPRRLHARAHLIDLTRLRGTTGTAQSEAETFRVLATSYGGIFGLLPTAVLASTPHVIGLARIFEIVAGLQEPPLPIRVVNTVDEATAFLGVDLAAAVEEINRLQRETPAEPHRE
jgi:hypothetical protein